MPKVNELPPRGHYLAHEVGQLAGVSGQTIGQWARNGYIRSSQSDGPPRVYSFQDVAEAMIVHELRDQDVSYPRIKRTIAELRERYGNGWPLQHAQLATSSKRVYASADDALYDIAQSGWQQLHLSKDLLRGIVGLLQRGGWAARELPDLEHIEVNPDRLSGRPTIRGRRIAAEKVARLAGVEGGNETLEVDYSLKPEEIRDATRWWKVAERFETAA
jgi:uncharacterized protein (DUF433 family)/DNA-binding transcriptional MerR regulator